MNVVSAPVKSILTRTGGFLRGVVSHSMQPYRGCAYGRSLCGVGCYVQHSLHITQGRPWGSFLEARCNAADVYRRQFARERAWAHQNSGIFSIFCSSATDPFVPQEARLGVTASLISAMVDLPPDRLILQTHSHTVERRLAEIRALADRCDLRLQMSIETDREQIKGLPPHASPIGKRFDVIRKFRDANIWTVVAVAPLLPIADPQGFFQRIADSADALIIDHFIGGDGTASGSRTLRTQLPIVMEQTLPGSASLAYRDAMIEVARRIMPGRVGVGSAGFAGNWL